MRFSTSSGHDESGNGTAVRTAIDTAIETVKFVKGIVPFEPASGALESLGVLLQMAQTHFRNKDELSEIAKRCQRVAYIIKKGDNSERMSEAQQRLKNRVDETIAIMEKKQARSSLRKAISIHGDAEEIIAMKEALSDFIAEFTMELGIIGNKGVEEILELIKTSQVLSVPHAKKAEITFYTPRKPTIFFGREEMVKDVVDTILNGQHVMLIGTGGMGKSSIAKAVLNEESIASSFEARLFITYDGVASSAMTYQLFLDRIATQLKLPNPDLTSMIQRLESITALLVIDNAETLLEADEVDSRRIAEVLDMLGGLTTTRIIATTRNHASVSPNFLCKRVTVLGIPMDAACDAFSAVYKIASFNDHIRAIFTALDYHPLSINILANAATMNQWSLDDIEQVWSERQTGVLDNANDKYRSLRVATEISIDSFKNKTLVLQILRAIAFLPQGIHRSDFSSLFPSIPNISREVEGIQRSSLIYRNRDRLTMLAPIRMYIADQYNQNLPYDDHALSCIRSYYHSRLSLKAHGFVEREHGNIDRLMHFDMTSSLYQSDIKIHFVVLYKAGEFLFVTSVQPSSLWPLLVAESRLDTFSDVDSLAQLTSLCLSHLCWIDYRRNVHNEALEKLEVAESYCRNHSPGCNKLLVRCLQLKSRIFQARGYLTRASKVLEEGSSIARALRDPFNEALLHQSLADVFLLQGKITRASSLFLSAERFYEANNQHSFLVAVFIARSYVFISQKDFANARRLLDNAMKIDQSHNERRMHLNLLFWKASCEGWAADVVAALRILQEATDVEVSPGTSQFRHYLTAIRGRAYYEARMGRYDDARNSNACRIEIGRESGKDFNDDFVSALITNLAGERATAISMIQKILEQQSGEDRQITAIYHRALGEIMLLTGRDMESRTHFEQAKAICNETGISPEHLYVNQVHWYSLPDEYCGWERFLNDAAAL